MKASIVTFFMRGQRLFLRATIMASKNIKYFNTLCTYEAPEWANCLKQVPQNKMMLGHLNTPIHKWDLPGLPRDVDLYIKRDDMTGSTIGGNKIRKLEFLLADALQKGCKHVITCGGIQSNHCRAVAAASAQLSLQCHLVLRAGFKNVEEAGCQGNVFLDKLCGAKLYLAPKVAPYQTELLPRMQRLAKKIKDETGEDSYLMEVGGSSDIGFYGYLEAYNEMIQQGIHENFDDIVFACGSGGTAEGLGVANYLTGSKLRVHPAAICDDASYFCGHGNKILEKIGLKTAKLEDMLDFIEGAKGLGYGLSNQEELDFITKVGMATGIILDPVYTAKAAKALVHELNTNPSRFKGKRVLFIHTGGIFGTYDGRLDVTLENHVKILNNCHLWLDKEKDPED